MVGVEVGSPGPAVRLRPYGFAGSALRLNARRCDKPTLYSNDPAPGRLIIHYFLSEVRASPCADLLALVISCTVGAALISKYHVQFFDLSASVVQLHRTRLRFTYTHNHVYRNLVARVVAIIICPVMGHSLASAGLF